MYTYTAYNILSTYINYNKFTRNKHVLNNIYLYIYNRNKSNCTIYSINTTLHYISYTVYQIGLHD